MLKTMRKNTRVIIWSVVLCFALWGGFSVGAQFQKKGRVAGEVFGRDVSFQEFNRFYRSSQIFSFGDKPVQDPAFLRQQAWQNIIFSKEARRRKIDVGDNEVQAEILRLLALQKIENPTTEVYRRWLDATVRETPQEFEKQIRELLRVQKMIREVNSSEDLPKKEAEELAQQKFLADHMLLSLEALKFPTQEAAAAFRQKAASAAVWTETIKKESLKPETTGMISISALGLEWGLPEQAAQALFSADKNTISQPLPLKQGFGLFRIIDKQAGSGEKFTDEIKARYVQEVQNRADYQKFLVWSVELLEKARLKDFMPQAEPEQAPAA